MWTNRIRGFIHTTCNLLIHTSGLMFMVPRFWTVKLCLYSAFLPVFTNYIIFVSFLFWCFVFTLNHPVLNFSRLILFPFLAIEYILIRSVCGYTVPLTVGKIGCRCLFKNSYHNLCWDELSVMSAPKFQCGPLGMQWNKNRQLLNCNQGIFHMLFEERWKHRR